jgi:DNA-binding response OmpR family regulator
MAKRILLVDDEPQLLFSVKEFLCRVGYEIIPAESGSQALERLIDSPPDLIISDILMEEMDGFEFQRRVNSLTGASIPFIFLTAKGDLRDRLEGLRGGADDYVIKPFEPEELEARVAAILKRVEHTRLEDRREVDYLRTRILGEVSRQLRTPVTSIMAHLNLLLLERFGQDQKKQERYLRSAVEDVNMLRSLIHDLSWAATDAGEEFLLKREPIRVAPVVRSAAANAAKLASDKGISLQITCGGLLSANLDGTAMSRALAGLLESAIELSDPGTRVQISALRAREGGLQFVIADGGCSKPAIDGADAADAVTDGLDLARRVVKGHGGQLSIQREDGGRQNIVIWLPGRVAKHIGARKS